MKGFWDQHGQAQFGAIGFGEFMRLLSDGNHLAVLSQEFDTDEMDIDGVPALSLTFNSKLYDFVSRDRIWVIAGSAITAVMF